jgi:hypothetical protein
MLVLRWVNAYQQSFFWLCLTLALSAHFHLALDERLRPYNRISSRCTSDGVDWEVLRRLRDLGREVGNGESMRRFSVQLPVGVAGWVDEVAGRKGKTPGSLLAEIIAQSAAEDAEPLDLRLQRLNGLIGQMSALTREIYGRREA